jgi:hypothetical protein
MEREKLKILLSKLRHLVVEIESEVYSDDQPYTSSYDGFSSAPLVGDYDEVYADDESCE